MIVNPNPIQHALIAQLLQQAVQPPHTDGGYSWARRGFVHSPGPNPNIIQQGGRVLPEVPDPNAQGDWSYSQPWVNTPTVVTPGYRPSPGQNVIQEDPAPQDPASVFGAMRQALPSSTRSNIHSHQQALIQRFMRNQRGKART